MKFKTFRNLAVLSGIFTVCLAGYAWNATHPDEPRAPRPTQPIKQTPQSPEDANEQARRELEAKANRALADLQKNRDPQADPVLAAILERIVQPCPESKVKDAFKGSAYKVNLYGEGGKVVRLKVDLDRDEKWDEKWSLEAPGQLEGLKRQISTADDGVSYDRELLYRGGVFRPEGGPAETAPPAANPGGGGSVAPPEPAPPAPSQAGGESGALEPHHTKLIEMVQRGIGGPGKKVKDAWKDGPKVSIYHDEGSTIPNRAKVDLDRDGKWDEKWDFEPQANGLKIKRRVSTADDDVSYDKEFRLREGRWVLKN